ncbi:hypothetical protein V5O48_001289 [Marasmius crinis-equi]|uniref:Uncharacterized protein n=1 Tax=Marasmius crinis-equi TaxID=585013 RepID=A0ABR3FYU0_9AGAR
MIPLIPTLILAFLSFICSAFVILRIVVPILPPHPLSRRVSPSEFGLPNFRSLSPADKSHLWLASLDLLALVIFVWQAISEYTGGPTGYANSQDPLASVRLWFALTARQTCLLVIVGITLLHVRLGRSVTFGSKHWMLWGLTFVLVATSTALAGVLTAADMTSLFVGVLSYSTFIGVCTSVVFACLVGTLINIKRNLTALNEEDDSWPPKEVEEKPRPSFATDDVDAIRDGASWITSNASSRRDSVSAWSFTTHQTAATSNHGHGLGRPQNGGHASVPGKSAFWFGAVSQEHIPPVPPLPSPYGPISPTSASLAEPDPFGRAVTPTSTSQLVPQHPRQRFGSQTSWLTSSAGSHATMSAWSFPANGSSPNLQTTLLPSTAVNGSRPATPAMAEAKVLGGYGYTPKDSEAGIAGLALAPGTSLDITVYRAIGWFFTIWIPLALSYPYLISLSQDHSATTIVSILLTLSVTLSSPLLALNILCRSPLPIPDGLFDVHGDLPGNLVRGPSPTNTEPTLKWSHEYKRSTSASVTVIEGRRSGDVWLSKGDAIDGRSKMSRAMSMMSPMPKLSVLPPQEVEDGELTPPLPIQLDETPSRLSYHNRSHSETSAQFGRIRKESQASSNVDDSLAYASRIMVAQKHYSTLAQTVHVPASPEKRASADERLLAEAEGYSNSVQNKRISAVGGSGLHIRTRSVSSISGPKTPTTGDSFNVSPPPAFPLPPTPPNVRTARLAKQHKRSFSSEVTGYSFGAVDDMNEIDALTAGVLPLLVPGLKVGDEMKIRDSPPATWSRRGRGEASSKSKSHSRSRSRSNAGRVDGKTARLLRALEEFGEEFSSPEIHSTPARSKAKALEQRKRKMSAHKRNHMSLPSLGLGKDGVHSFVNWANDVGRALETKIGQYTAVPSSVELSGAARRNTVFGGETSTGLRASENVERGPSSTTLGRAMSVSTRNLGLRAEVPHGVDTARSSMVSMNGNHIPPSAASTVTLFDFEASGPQAESTPHNNHGKRVDDDDELPPLPSPHQLSAAATNNRNRNSRRSSIVYIKSDENVTPPNANTNTRTNVSSGSSSFARAVRPLIPKSSKLLRKVSKAASPPTNTTQESPRGLRPLSLLGQNAVDFNSNAGVVETVGSSGKAGTRPLILGKKQKSRKERGGDENVGPSDPQAQSLRTKAKHNLKPLNLARSETSKMRGILRAREELPDVVVRPPSTYNAEAMAYGFREY